jgi:thiol-disulfide isomerase/thioredoxin
VGETLSKGGTFTDWTMGRARPSFAYPSPSGSIVPLMTRARFDAALRYDQMVASAQKNVELWTLTRRRATVTDADVAAVEALGVPLHLLVLSADWCIDSASSLPFLDALAERAANLDLRILDRDENLDLMDAHLFRGKSRSIPCVIAYDDQFVEHGAWGPRPTAMQALLESEWAALDKPAQLAEKRRWYAKDRGVSSVREIIALLEVAATANRQLGVTAFAPTEAVLSAAASAE